MSISYVRSTVTRPKSAELSPHNNAHDATEFQQRNVNTANEKAALIERLRPYWSVRQDFTRSVVRGINLPFSDAMYVVPSLVL
jgi:hypothetical protein